MFLIVNYLTAYPAVYGQFPQALQPPLSAVAPTQREGKNYVNERCIPKYIYFLYFDYCYYFSKRNILLIFSLIKNVFIYLMD